MNFPISENAVGIFAGVVSLAYVIWLAYMYGWKNGERVGFRFGYRVGAGKDYQE